MAILRLVPALLVAALLLHPSSTATAQEPSDREEILSYDVHVDVRDGGVFRVREAITVQVLGREIRRGIYRDFPTSFPGGERGLQRWAGRVVAPFRVLSVERNGSAEPYTLESVGGPAGRGGVRVRIGDAGVLLPHGAHRYVLTYETERWLTFDAEPGRDRIDWNVTGNGWGFPIRSASAAVRLPARSSAGASPGATAGAEAAPPAERVELAAWTGPVGATSQDARWSWDADAGVARFATTRPLGPGEGLTVRVAFPSGVVAPPTDAQRASWFELDWGGWRDAAIIVGLLIALYLAMWVNVGKDPARGTIVVRYEPPEGFSAAALGYLDERGYAARHLTGALVSLAVKGLVTIEKDGNDWTISRAGPEKPPGDLPDEERRLYEELFDTSGIVSLEGSSNPTLRKALKAFRGALGRRLERTYFVNNRRWFALGLAVTVAGFGLLAWDYRWDIDPAALFLGVWLSFWTVGVVTLLVRTGTLWKEALSGNTLHGVGAVFMTLFSLPFLAGEVFVGGLLYTMVPAHILTAAIVLGATNVLFYHLLERPTLRGRGVLDHLDGFRRFLGATDEDRLDRLQEPDRSLELFERYLPHAIALGLENRWAERFQGVLAPALLAETSGGSGFAWYSGGSTGDLGGFTSSLGSSLSSSISASSAAPSSGGSGGGGGGSSGGGGGGGGGGGW